MSPAPLFDTHCHLDAPEFDGQRQLIIAQAHAVGVCRIMVPAVALSNFSTTLALRTQAGCAIALGLHPVYLDQHLDTHLDALEQHIRQHTPDAIGEIGLDFWLPELDPVRQEWLFAEQLKLARRYDLPVLLHIRRAQDRVLKYLRQIPVRGGIAHAFNGSEQQAQAFIKLGFCLGFGGAMSYSGSTRIRQLVATLPLESLVLETDAPDMRPEWAQDIPNVPANLPRLAHIMAELRATDSAAIAQATTDNACRVLNLP
ncbi:TatD family hydrolase [Craterilacuibacter sp.]|uniref:TatD family hydrolase n=1 Tax=Craterilacuibacter sp. TaxID=2870909 RepID=UPI003F3FFEFE